MAGVMDVRIRMFFSACFVLLSIVGRAQTSTTNGWIVSSHEQKLSKKWSLLSDFQLRSADHFRYVETALIRPAIQYKIADEKSAAFGYAYVGSWEREGAERSFEIEHRVWQQFVLESKLSKTEVTNRLRLEQRFLQTEKDFDFAQRLRYYLRFQIPFSSGTEFKRGAFLGLQNEIFFNIHNKEAVNNRLFDQNRALAGIGFRFSEALDVEAGYLFRYQIEEERLRNHILQLTAITSF